MFRFLLPTSLLLGLLAGSLSCQAASVTRKPSTARHAAHAQPAHRHALPGHELEASRPTRRLRRAVAERSSAAWKS